MANIIFKLISLSREFSQKYTVSIYDLLQQTGYPNIADKISEEDLSRELVAHPDFVNDWLEYSQNKRCDNGWYFKLGNTNKYLVGCLDERGSTETEYDDKIKACAAFIKQELDQIIESVKIFVRHSKIC